MANYPENWRATRLTTFLKKVRRPVAVEPQALYRQIGVRSFGKGSFHKEPVTGEGLGGKRVFWVRPGDFVLNIVFAWEGAVALISEAEEGMCASHRFPTFIIDDTICDPAFLLLYFKTKKGVEQLALASPGGAGRNRTLNQSDFLNLIIALPPLPEQRKIAEILSSWDSAVSTLDQLITALERRKRGLMQRLLTGLIRISKEGVEWERFPIGELFEKIVAGDWGEEADGSDQCYPVIRAANFSKDCKLDLAPQKIVIRKLSPRKVNALLLEKGNLLLEKSGGSPEQPVGRIVYFNGESKGFGYSNFLQKLEVKSRFDPQLIYYFLHWNYLSGKVLQYQQKTTGIINFQLKDYLRFEKISLPNDAQEQEYIVGVSRACDEQLLLYKQQLSARKNQRHGLAQRLLAGQVRVRVDEE